MHPSHLTAAVGHNQLLPESLLFHVCLRFWKEIFFFFFCRAVADEDLKLTKVVSTPTPTKNCYEQKSAPSDLALRRNAVRQDSAPVFPPFALLSRTNSGEETDIFLISAWNIGLPSSLHLQCVFSPLFAPSFSLIWCVFSANALELEDGRTGSTKAFLHTPNEQRFIPAWLWPVRAQILTCSNKVCYINMYKKEELWNKILSCLIFPPFFINHLHAGGWSSPPPASSTPRGFFPVIQHMKAAAARKNLPSYLLSHVLMAA